jgi:rifampicin phosphotransferase
VRRRLAGRPLRRVAFELVLARTRWGIKTRERLRLTRGRMAALFRDHFRALGRALAERDLLDAPEDVFLLTYEEIGQVVRGGCATGDLRALVSLRRAEYEAREGVPAVGRITTHGVVHGHSVEAHAKSEPGEGRLTGIGCSPGRVRAVATVVRKPESNMKLDGEILVAATTDPGWVFLMVAAGGLISEKGSVLSHTAIIGRELGIPAVVGVKDATRLLPHGGLIELDGSAGTVEVLERG